MPTELPIKDIHLPELIGHWPPAIGWWLLLVALIMLVVLSWWAVKQITQKTPIKQAKQLLGDIERDHDDDLHTLQQLSCWLRRVSISVSPRHDSAGLTGDAWLHYLDKDLDDSPFTQGVGRHIIDAPFRQTTPDNVDMAALISLCKTWLARQK